MINMADLCNSINFAKKYYALVDRYKVIDGPPIESFFDFVDYFEANDFSAKKVSAESVILLREAANPDWGLNVATSNYSIELIFASPVTASTFHGLAYDCAMEHAKALVRNPRYPRINMPARDELYPFAGEVHQLYLELKTVVNATQ